MNFPHSIDVHPTAKCNLRCTFCWGPEHDIPDGLTGEEWVELLEWFYKRGTRAVVFTGGEPLIRKDLDHIIRGASEIGYRITLSSNGILLPSRMEKVGQYVEQVGLPLDGASPELNAAMRIGKSGSTSFNAVMKAMRAVREFDPSIEITIRTVVSRVNASSVHRIAEVLNELEDYWDRWKLYQFVSAGIGLGHKDEHSIDDLLFNEAIERAASGLRSDRMTVQPSKDRPGRYFFVGPRGELFTAAGIEGDRLLGQWQDCRDGGLDLGEVFTEAVDADRNSRHA